MVFVEGREVLRDWRNRMAEDEKGSRVQGVKGSSDAHLRKKPKSGR
jgi:hypothetical protein